MCAFLPARPILQCKAVPFKMHLPWIILGTNYATDRAHVPVHSILQCSKALSEVSWLSILNS